MIDQDAYEVLKSAWPDTGLPEPSDAELHAAMCVARLETQYGEGWKSVMVGSNNWGAIQAGKPPARPGYSRLYQDTHPNEKGTSTIYHICFREYPTPEEGAADFLRVLYVRRPKVLAAAGEASIQAVAEAMHESGYYEGFGATIESRIANYANALWRNYQTILKRTGWQPVLSRRVDFPPSFEPPRESQP